MILAKSIKPAKLRDDKMRLELLTAMNEIGEGVKKDFERTTKTWNHKVKFVIVKAIPTNLGRVEILVGTDDPIYRYVNEGTKEHIILPKKATRLRFKGTYTAKTQPGVIDARPGGSSGEDVFSMGVIHPGNKARNFDDAIAKHWQIRMKRRMEESMRRAVQVSGHAI